MTPITEPPFKVLHLKEADLLLHLSRSPGQLNKPAEEKILMIKILLRLTAQAGKSVLKFSSFAACSEELFCTPATNPDPSDHP